MTDIQKHFDWAWAGIQEWLTGAWGGFLEQEPIPQATTVVALVGIPAVVSRAAWWLAVERPRAKRKQKDAAEPARRRAEEERRRDEDAREERLRMGEELARQRELIERLLQAGIAKAGEPVSEGDIAAARPAIERAVADIEQDAAAADADQDDRDVEAAIAQGDIDRATRLLEMRAHETTDSARMKAARDLRNAAAINRLSNVKRAAELYRQAAALDPDDLRGLRYAGQLSVEAGNLEDAASAFERGVETADTRQDAWWSYCFRCDLGDVRVAQGRLPDALELFEEAKSYAERLAASDPGNAGWQRDLSVSLEKAGDVQVAQGDLTAALASYEASRAILERLAASDPGNAGWQRDLEISNERIGDMHVRQGDATRAIDAFERALAAYSNLLKRNPDDIQSLVFSVVPHWRLGRLKGSNGAANLQAALAILKPLAAANRLDAGRRRWIAAIEADLAKVK